MKKNNLFLAVQWLIFLPVIMPLCVVFGALQGIVSALDQMAQQIWHDVFSVDAPAEENLC